MRKYFSMFILGTTRAYNIRACNWSRNLIRSIQERSREIDNISPPVLYRETERDACEWSIGSNEIEINSTSRGAGLFLSLPPTLPLRRDVQR